ncbi:hypothetical protein QNO07_06895 [Streptomyces sp. 549]|uniref:hypothetical protein n=1 Tax=Streptomyces sp. 549 TaxID=3049076 RepID=UPI0024C32D7E|nr:hypothetical protein [Streptomyces sp. 549]MDK1473149.1 hypothetical protein [Streptomyces sp. 549]
MDEPAPLRPEDGAAFENALQRALDTPDVRAALRRPDAPYAVDALRARVRTAADTLAAEAAPEYKALLDVRSRTARAAPASGEGEGVKAVVAALAVLTPLLSAVATAIFLLLGHILRAMGVAAQLAEALIGAGWTAAAVTAATGLAAGAGLALTVKRHRVAERHGPLPDAVAQAHAAWLNALLRRGLLPHLRRELGLPESPALAASTPTAQPDRAPTTRARLGYSRPDFGKPDYGKPDYATPDFGKPDFASPDYASPDFGKPVRPFEE